MQHKQDIIGRFAQHKVAANLFMFLLLLLGGLALRHLNTQFLPTFNLESVMLRVIWPAASAQDVEQSITIPLEQALSDLDFIKEMRSTSARGISSIIFEYEEHTDMNQALEQLKSRIDTVRSLPEESKTPEISHIIHYEPVASLILTGKQQTLQELHYLAKQYEQQLLSQGIAKIVLEGIPEEEIAIQIKQETLQLLGENFNSLSQSIRENSQDIPAGSIGNEEFTRELRGLNKKITVSDFQQLVIPNKVNGMVKLGDIATIEQRYKDEKTLLFYKNQPAIMIKLLRDESADTLASVNVLDKWLQKTRNAQPKGVELIVFNEVWELLADRIHLLLKNGSGGLLLVVGILFLFLNGRVAFWVAIGIPVSFAGTLAILYVFGGSINMISLFALIMALGIIVDDAIVVGEDALTHYQKGEKSLQAAEGGARRMLVPVLSSSLTTIAAFLPLMLIGGHIGNILFAIPLVIVSVIIASLVESFLILPGHLRWTFHYFHNREKAGDRKKYPLREKLDRWFIQFQEGYFRPALGIIMAHRIIALTLAIAIFIFAIGLLLGGRLAFTFFPTPTSPSLIASVKFSPSVSAVQVQHFADQMETALWQADRYFQQQSTEQESIIKMAVKRYNSASFNGGANFQEGEQYTAIQVELTAIDARDVSNQRFIQEWRKRIPPVAGIEQFVISSPRGGPPGEDIDIFLSGGHLDNLKQASKRLIQQLETFAGVSNVQDDLPFGREQWIYRLTAKGIAQGITVQSLGTQLRTAFDGQIVQIIYEENNEIEVRVMLPRQQQAHLSSLQHFPIFNPQGEQFVIEDIATLHLQAGVAVLRHSDSQLGVHITADIDSSINNANRVLANIEDNYLPDLIHQYHVQYQFKGRAEDQKETSSDMLIGALLALLMIYFILAWVFSSYSWPFAIMLTIPFSLAGAIFGHVFMGIDLTILSLFGLFALAGIVINDAIILITFYQQLRSQGMSYEKAIIEASCLRLRAVLLTSLTTIAGLVPLLFETSLQAQFLIPMAVSISFGLALATVLVLIIVPVLLSYIEEFKNYTPLNTN